MADDDTSGGALGGASAGGIAGGAVSGAMAGASFGPYGMIAGAAVGIGLQLFGGISSHDAAAQFNQSKIQEIQLEQQVEGQRKLKFELENNRAQTENFRNTQKAKAMGLAASVNQGAQFGSGAAGGQAEAQSQGNYNQLSLNQNFQIGEDTYRLNAQISQARIQQAQSGMAQQTGQALQGLGSGIMGSLGALGRVSSGFGPQST